MRRALSEDYGWQSRGVYFIENGSRAGKARGRGNEKTVHAPGTHPANQLLLALGQIQRLSNKQIKTGVSASLFNGHDHPRIDWIGKRWND
jgi:hypothetical protein